MYIFQFLIGQANQNNHLFQHYDIQYKQITLLNYVHHHQYISLIDIHHQNISIYLSQKSHLVHLGCLTIYYNVFNLSILYNLHINLFISLSLIKNNIIEDICSISFFNLFLYIINILYFLSKFYNEINQ